MTLEILSLVHEVGQWVIRLVIIPVLARENRPSVAWAWLALFAFVPWIALLLYVLFGRPFLLRRLRRRSLLGREITARVDGGAAAEPGSSLVHGVEGAGLARMIEHLTEARHGGLAAVGGNTADLLTETGAAIDRMIADIERAEHHVHLLFFIFNDDSTGRRIAEALAAAARRGVTCRVLVDAFGSRVVAKPSFFKALGPWLEERGVEVHDVLAARLARRALARFDLRNHRKIAVLDGRVAYTGSLNLHDDDFGLDERLWLQMTVRLKGPVVRQLQLLFIEDWSFATGQRLDGAQLFPSDSASAGLTAQVVPGGPDDDTDPILHLLVGAISSSHERVVITTPYFVPDESMHSALCVAALRGVQVDLILPEASDRAIADAAARAYLHDLLRAGVRVHLSHGGLLHAKSMSIDDRLAILGSANFDRRSLFLNYEANVVIYDAAFATHLRSCQEGYLQRATTLTLEDWEKGPALRRHLDEMAKLFSPLL